MKGISNKGASMTFYISMWIGIIVVGALMYPGKYTKQMDYLRIIFNDPGTGSVTVLRSAFTSSAASSIIAIVLGAGVFSFLANWAIGGGFSLLFAIPAIIIIAVVNMFLLPTTEILNQSVPYEVQIIYIAFISGLTILTVMSFTSGRQ